LFPPLDVETAQYIAESEDLMLDNDEDCKRVTGIRLWTPDQDVL